MRDTATEQKLSADAERVVAEVLAQLERQSEAMRGLCAVSTTTHRQHGRFTLEEEGTHETAERLDRPDEETESEDFLALLSGDEYERREIQSTRHGEICIRAVRGEDATTSEEEMTGADLVFQRSPARLLRASIHPPKFSGLIGMLFSGAETEVRFKQVNGVPMPSETHVRMRSRGIGTFRLDQETKSTVQYEEYEELPGNGQELSRSSGSVVEETQRQNDEADGAVVRFSGGARFAAVAASVLLPVMLWAEGAGDSTWDFEAWTAACSVPFFWFFCWMSQTARIVLSEGGIRWRWHVGAGALKIEQDVSLMWLEVVGVHYYAGSFLARQSSSLHVIGREETIRIVQLMNNREKAIRYIADHVDEYTFNEEMRNRVEEVRRDVAQ